MMILLLICMIIYFCSKSLSVFKSDLISDIKKRQNTEWILVKENYPNNNNTSITPIDTSKDSYPGMPFITIKIGKHKIMALIDTWSQKSTVSLEVATKCELIRQIDRRNIENIIGMTSPTTIYGTIYNQKIIINNGKISGKSN